MSEDSINEFLNACGAAGLNGEFVTTNGDTKYVGTVTVNADGSYKISARQVMSIDESRARIKAILNDKG